MSRYKASKIASIIDNEYKREKRYKELLESRKKEEANSE